MTARMSKDLDTRAIADTPFNVRALIEEASTAAGGLRSLALELEWNPGSIIKARTTQKLSPYRSAQIAELLGTDPDISIFQTLRDGSKTESERKYWCRRLERATAHSREAQHDYQNNFPAWLIEDAINKAGGVRALARAIDGWDAASVVKARDNMVLSPYRAAQLALYVGVDAQKALMTALATGSKSAGEADFWKAFDKP